VSQPTDLQLSAETDLGTILEAWHAATVRLEQTHEALQAEVRRLTAELERKNRELARKDRLADLGRMAAHIAHELRNSLVPVALYLSILDRRIEDPESRDVLRKVIEAVRAAETTVSDLLQFAADREPKESLFALLPLVEEILAGLHLQIEAQKIKTFVNIPQSLFVWADRELIRRVLLNLVLNALDAMPQGGCLEINAQTDNGDLSLAIADSGPGLDEDRLQKIFEPFYTTKPNGTGLGLAVVERLIELHGGTVEASNVQGGGAKFLIILPQRVMLSTSQRDTHPEISG
jgi:two-component system sensor histidine kinase HydH